LESKASALATSSHLDQSRPKLKLWTPTRLNLSSLGKSEMVSSPPYQRGIRGWSSATLP